MRRLSERFDALMAAIAFAEAGDAETARRMIADSRRDEDGEEAGRRPIRG